MQVQRCVCGCPLSVGSGSVISQAGGVLLVQNGCCSGRLQTAGTNLRDGIHSQFGDSFVG